MKEVRILSIVNTAFELYYLSAVAVLLKYKRKNIKIDLLIKPAIKNKISPELKKIYRNIRFISFPTYTYSFQGIKKILVYKKKIKKIVKPYDIICISSFREFFANILCRQVSSKTRLIALTNVDPFDDKEFTEKKPFKFISMNLFNFIFGYSTFKYRWLPNSDDVYYKFFNRCPYQKSIFFTDSKIGIKMGNPILYGLPPPFGVLKKYFRKKKSKFLKPAILIVGERTPVYSSWSKKDQKNLDSFYCFLRENFKNHHFYYKPRPRLTDLKKVSLRGYKLMAEDLSLGDVFLKNDFVKVISIKSTGSVLASYFGHQAYFLYPLFDFPRPYLTAVKKLFEKNKSVVRVKKNKDIFKTNKSGSLLTEKLARQYQEAILD